MLKDESDKKNRQPVNDGVLTLLNVVDAAIDMWVIYGGQNCLLFAELPSIFLCHKVDNMLLCL